MTRTFLASLLFFTVACGNDAKPQLAIATTTSVVNSGLLEAILPLFEQQRSIVRVHAVGSGQALKMLEEGTVGLVIAHAPRIEAQYLSRQPGWAYAKIAFNEFVIVGPAADPAQVNDASTAVDAFQRIARGAGRFVSRGDSSGTFEREQALWAAAGRTSDRISTSGGSMAVTLRQASELNAYTLTDDATFRQLEAQLDLRVLFHGDPLLVNTYAVITPRSDERGMAFAEWLRGPGQAAIANHMVGGQPAYSRWPENCRADSPEALPCH